MLAVSLWAIVFSQGCLTPPPAQPDSLCAIYGEHRGWHKASLAAEQRWGVSPAAQLAIVHQESRFRADARPQRGRFLGVFPGSRPTSAYGYGQVIDSTWRSYQRSTGRWSADRDDFRDVADFIGWYAHVIRQQTGVKPANVRELYIAYHEGPGGYLRGEHRKKTWLSGVANKVSARAAMYARQHAECRERLERSDSRSWPF